MNQPAQANQPSADRKRSILIGAGLLGALTASSCCIVPFVLFSLGISGAWIGSLTVLAPYQSYFIGFTVFCLLGSVYYLYWRPQKTSCVPGAYCESPKASIRMKIMLWLTLSIVCLTLSWPFIVRLFLH